MRLERAAFRLSCMTTLYWRSHSTGFRGPETFSRAFSRNFGVSPSAYRNKARSSQAEVLAATTQSPPADFAISETKIRRLRPFAPRVRTASGLRRRCQVFV
ncbi:MAG: AraC family transcriptional regulator [Proteobacteria bacterium]|nr:AraC family transcriptional regulator [Pseudomonadota bacterium]